MKLIIACQKCNGTGRIQMSEDHPTAINNRLEFFRQAGFVTRRRIGRQWAYTSRLAK